MIMPPPFSYSDATPTGLPAGGYSQFPQSPGMFIGFANPTTPFVNTPWEDAGGNIPSMERKSGDYFSTGAGGSRPIAIAKNAPSTADTGDEAPPPSVEKEKEETSLLGRLFGAKRLGRSLSTDMGGSKPVAVAIGDKAAALLEEAEDKADPLDDFLGGVIKRIRGDYDIMARRDPNEPIASSINPSLPLETPVLKPPLNTEIIIQEDKPDFGGVADSLDHT